MRKLKIKNFVWLCIGIVILGGGYLFIRLGHEKVSGKVLARVGNTVLTEPNFYNLIPPHYAGILTLSQKKELLKKWVDTELIYQSALKEGIHKEPQIKSKLRQLEQEVIANEFIERYISKVSSVGEAEIRAYFDLHESEYNTERKAAQILVLDKEQADELVSQLREGADFSSLARQYSLDQSAQRNGVIGYIRRGDMPQLAEFEEALFSLSKPGDISDPVQTTYGYYIIKLLDIRPLPTKVKYEEVREKIRSFLNFIQRKRVFTDLLDSLRNSKDVEINYELLE